MNLIIGWLVKKFGASAILLAIESLYVGSIIAFFIFVIQAISYLHFLFVTLTNYLSSANSIANGSANSVDYIHILYGYLNVIGFFPALVTAWPFIESALTFLFMRFLWKFFLRAYKSFVLSVYHVASTL